MTKILLIRCAAHERPGILVGRDLQVGLSRQGLLDATALALQLVREGVTRLQASPQRRARETAALAATRLGLETETVDALDDMDFGNWKGLPFVQLDRADLWCLWNRDRESVKAPGGEAFSDVQERIVTHLGETFVRCPGETVAMVTHLEPIRAAVLDQRNLPLSAWNQINVPHGNVIGIGGESGASQYSAVA